MPTTATLPPWLAALPCEDGIIAISDARRFAHEEAAYDSQYTIDPANLRVGRGLYKLIAEVGGDTSAPAFEIGCGTGLLSLGMVADSPYSLTILSDPSPQFLRITRNKIRSAGLSDDRACFAVFRAEDIDRLPSQSLSLIALRSTLHHVNDVDTVLKHCARALVPGGVLAFQEPCMEGFILMGAMIQFLPALASAEGVPLTDAQRAKVDLFSAAMAFYARRDLDKSNDEDKHLFRVDEITRTCSAAGLEMSFFANTTFEAAVAEPRTGQHPFKKFFRDYCRYCMSWDSELLAIFDRFMPPYCKMIETASGGGSGPYFDGVFIARKVR